MEPIEKLMKLGVLSAFSFLNALDLVQTISFLRMGIEANTFVLNYPYVWFPLKFALAFGFPLGIYKLDIWLTKKEDDGKMSSFRSLVDVAYLMIFLATIFFLFLVIRNMRLLGGKLLI